MNPSPVPDKIWPSMEPLHSHVHKMGCNIMFLTSQYKSSNTNFKLALSSALFRMLNHFQFSELNLPPSSSAFLCALKHAPEATPSGLRISLEDWELVFKVTMDKSKTVLNAMKALARKKKDAWRQWWLGRVNVIIIHSDSPYIAVISNTATPQLPEQVKVRKLASGRKKSHIRRPDRNCPSWDPNPFSG